MDKTRIATVKATGLRYVVNQLDFRANKAHCWGEVTAIVSKGRSLQTRHDGQKMFLLDAVDIVEVPRTRALLETLFNQRLQVLRAKGHVIEDRTSARGKRRVTDYGTPADIERRQQASRAVNTWLEETGLLPALNAAVDRAALRGGIDSPYVFREPSVTQGPDLPIPETRSEVLEKIVDRLAAEGAHLQRYSNGEFTSSSLAVGLTFEACKGVEILECPGYTIHFDVALGLYWRHGGSWD